jgi:hypothetical protein
MGLGSESTVVSGRLNGQIVCGARVAPLLRRSPELTRIARFRAPETSSNSVRNLLAQCSNRQRRHECPEGQEGRWMNLTLSYLDRHAPIRMLRGLVRPIPALLIFAAAWGVFVLLVHELGFYARGASDGAAWRFGTPPPPTSLARFPSTPHPRRSVRGYWQSDRIASGSSAMITWRT